MRPSPKHKKVSSEPEFAYSMLFHLGAWHSEIIVFEDILSEAEHGEQGSKRHGGHGGKWVFWECFVDEKGNTEEGGNSKGSGCRQR